MKVLFIDKNDKILNLAAIFHFSFHKDCVLLGSVYKVSKYDQEIPQSQTADPPQHREEEHRTLTVTRHQEDN